MSEKININLTLHRTPTGELKAVEVDEIALPADFDVLDLPQVSASVAGSFMSATLSAIKCNCGECPGKVATMFALALGEVISEEMELRRIAATADPIKN